MTSLSLAPTPTRTILYVSRQCGIRRRLSKQLLEVQKRRGIARIRMGALYVVSTDAMQCLSHNTSSTHTHGRFKKSKRVLGFQQVLPPLHLFYHHFQALLSRVLCPFTAPFSRSLALFLSRAHTHCCLLLLATHCAELCKCWCLMMMMDGDDG